MFMAEFINEFSDYFVNLFYFLDLLQKIFRLKSAQTYGSLTRMSASKMPTVSKKARTL